MKTFFKLLFVFAFFISCGDPDTAVYSGDSSNQTLLSFSSSVYSLQVEIDNVGSLDVKLNSSTVSDVDRTFNVSIVPEETTADPLTYTLPSTVTIPAGSYQGILTIAGTDNGLEDSTVLTIAFEPAGENVTFDSNKAIINVNQVCPVEATKFQGTYRLEQTSAPSGFGNAFVDQTLQIVKLGDPASDLALGRSFSAIYLEDAGVTGELTFNFDLLCGNVVLSETIDSGLRCSAGSTITVGPATTPGTFNVDDDSVFFLTFTEFVTDGNCGAPPLQTTIRFTKL